MPVTQDQFDSGGDDVEPAVLWFLRGNFDLAYTAQEILFELGSTGVLSTLDGIERALISLMARERLESSVLAGIMYYRYNRRLGFRPSK